MRTTGHQIYKQNIDYKRNQALAVAIWLYDTDNIVICNSYSLPIYDVAVSVKQNSNCADEANYHRTFINAVATGIYYYQERIDHKEKDEISITVIFRACLGNYWQRSNKGTIISVPKHEFEASKILCDDKVSEWRLHHFEETRMLR